MPLLQQLSETFRRDVFPWLATSGWHIVLVIVLAWLGNRLAARLIDRLFARLGRLAEAPGSRLAQRAATLGAILKSAVHLLVWVMAILTVLGKFIAIGPFLASIGVVGLGLSLGAQNMVRDFIGGFFILLEDQYGVGDVVTINGQYSGAVEAVTLRVTRLRSLDGQLIIIPNGDIQVVQNLSNEWARVVLDVPVPYDSPLEVVFRLLEETLGEFHRRHAEAILEPPEVLGVESFADSAVMIRLLVKTKPLRQWELARQLRRAVKEALDREGVSIPFPQLDVHFRPAEAAAEVLRRPAGAS